MFVAFVILVVTFDTYLPEIAVVQIVINVKLSVN